MLEGPVREWPVCARNVVRRTTWPLEPLPFRTLERCSEDTGSAFRHLGPRDLGISGEIRTCVSGPVFRHLRGSGRNRSQAGRRWSALASAAGWRRRPDRRNSQRRGPSTPVARTFVRKLGRRAYRLSIRVYRCALVYERVRVRALEALGMKFFSAPSRYAAEMCSRGTGGG